MTLAETDRWVRLYTTRLVEAGMSLAFAYRAAQIAVEHAADWLTPEDAANEELSHWEMQ